ncbi:MAG: hypothetical protein K0Q87_4526 [Neobacillus sp.]|nr:hypothetical protein [Neobacillus sp.]
MGDNIRVILVDMPIGYRAFTVPKDGFYTIYINSRYCNEQNRLSLNHELKHIENGDYDKPVPANLIEFYAHHSNIDYE